MHVRIGLIVVGIAGLIFAVAPAALAQRGGMSPPTSEGAAKERASLLLAQGNRKLDQGLYVDALALFEQAFAAFPSPKLHFNLGQTLYELGRHPEALLHYEQFLQAELEREMPTQWQRANQRVFELQGKVATVVVQCSLPGAEVKVDGVVAGVTPLSTPIRLSPGRHVLLIYKAEHERHVVELELRGGEIRTERVELLTAEQAVQQRAEFKRAEAARIAAEQKLQREREASKQAAMRRQALLRTAGWVTIGVGATAAIGAGVTGEVSRRAAAEVSDAREGTPWVDLQASYDRAATYRRASYITAAVSLTALAGGAGLLIYSRTVRARDSEERAVWVPELSTHGSVGLSVQGKF
jgi:tetratricopeptide (TPR) repeat protein